MLSLATVWACAAGSTAVNRVAMIGNNQAAPLGLRGPSRGMMSSVVSHRWVLLGNLGVGVELVTCIV